MQPAYSDVQTGLAGGISKKSEKLPKEKMPEPLPGAFHASDIEYLLGNLRSNDVFAWTDDDYRVSRLGHNYFVNFIKTGDPNGKRLFLWPKTTAKDKRMNILNLNVDVKTSAEEFRDRYLFLDKLYMDQAQKDREAF
jgi:Carboxylesterase type B